VPELETHGTEVENGWRDNDGFVGPRQPGTGPKKNPKGDFPTGPEVGMAMPDVVCHTADLAIFDLHEDRAGSRAIFVFYRSAVW